ncbi:uncharacterized protein LOC135393025 isoform X2 [Ornithodoros turicata]|uniref:uncharacterized protein LOC135393025 isoform X2 n=1 Tax=Ornithodoros turicata TaxID=34597 RepID=UPI0031396B8C
MEQYISNPEDPDTYTQLRRFRMRPGYHLIATLPLDPAFVIQTITSLPWGTQFCLTFYCIEDNPSFEMYFLYAKSSYTYWWAHQQANGDFHYVSRPGTVGHQEEHYVYNPTKKGGYISLAIQRNQNGGTDTYLNGKYVASRKEVGELSYFYNNKPIKGLRLSELHMTQWSSSTNQSRVFKHTVPLWNIGKLGIGSVVSFTVISDDYYSNINMQFIRHSNRESDKNDTTRAAYMGVAPRANMEIKGVCKMATFTATIWSDLQNTPITFDNNETLQNLDVAINNVSYNDIVMDVGLLQ